MNRNTKQIVALFVLLAVTASSHAQAPPPDTGAQRPPAATATAKKASVDLYVIPGCSYCEKARELLRARGVTWQEHDIANSAQAKRRFDAQRGKGTPLLVIGGDVIQGLDAPRIDQALQANGIVAK